MYRTQGIHQRGNVLHSHTTQSLLFKTRLWLINSVQFEQVILKYACSSNQVNIYACVKRLVRDSSAVRRLFSTCCSRVTSESSTYGKQRICPPTALFHVSWLLDFIFYQKPLYKSLQQSFFYSFITILPSESGVTLHYSTIFPQTL